MKFNSIIMNPPYDGNLHLKVLETALKEAKETCVNLSPVRWLQDPLTRFKKGTSDYTNFEKSISIFISDLEVISANEANSYFGRPILLQPLGIYKINNNGGFDYKSFNTNTILEKVIKLNTYKDMAVCNYTDDLRNYVCLNTMAPSMKYGRPYYETLKNFGYFIDGKNKDGFNYKEAKANCKEATRGDVSNTLCAVFEDPVEVKNCWDAFNTQFCRYCISASVVDIHVYQKFLPWVNNLTNPRTGLVGYKSDWTDEDFYNVFKITASESQAIRLAMA